MLTVSVEQLNNYFLQRNLTVDITEISELFLVTPEIVSKSFLKSFSHNYYHYYVHAQVNRTHETLTEKYRKLFQVPENSPFNNAIAISFWKEQLFSAFPFFIN